MLLTNKLAYLKLALLIMVVSAAFIEQLDACGGGGKGYGGKKGYGQEMKFKKDFGKKFKKFKKVKASPYYEPMGVSASPYYEPMGVRASRYSYRDEYEDDYEPIVRRPAPRQVVVRHEYARPAYDMEDHYEPRPRHRYLDELTVPRYQTAERPSMRREIGKAVTDALVKRLAVYS